MKKATGLIILILLLFSSNAFCERLSGSGFGGTKKEAREEALADLSQSIKVEVKSEFESIITKKNSGLDEMKTKAIHLKSDLPVLGAKYDDLVSKDGYMTEAILRFTKVKLYEEELNKIVTLINRELAAVEKADSSSAKTELFKSILANIDQYYKYSIVARLMHSKKIPEISITATEIKNRLKKLERKADTIDFGIKILTRNIKKENIYIYPPTTGYSSEITQFGSSVKDSLMKYLKATSRPDSATCYLSGEYKILKNGIELTVHLLDKKGNTLQTEMAFFKPSAYKDYQIKPVSIDFEKLIQSDHVVSGNFRADIRTEKGKRDLLYKKNDTMRLFVKMNRPGYFYFLVHNLKKEKYSYLVNFNDEPGNRKFVYYVSGDYVNKWVELGEFTIVAPFGVETLQLFASTKDIADSVPSSFYDDRTGLYKIGKKSGEAKPEKALATTRGLMMKKKTEKTEASLIFTSLEK